MTPQKSRQPEKKSRRQPIGRIVGAFGIRGQVKVEPMTDFMERFGKGRKLWIGDDPYTVETCSMHKGRPLVKLSGVDTIDAAEKLQWTYLESATRQKPILEEGEFMTEDLIGLRVVTESGELLGKVDDVQSFPAHDTLIVGAIMIPAVKAFVKDVDLASGQLVVCLIPGMRPEDVDVE